MQDINDVLKWKIDTVSRFMWKAFRGTAKENLVRNVIPENFFDLPQGDTGLVERPQRTKEYEEPSVICGSCHKFAAAVHMPKHCRLALSFKLNSFLQIFHKFLRIVSLEHGLCTKAFLSYLKLQIFYANQSSSHCNPVSELCIACILWITVYSSPKNSYYSSWSSKDISTK